MAWVVVGHGYMTFKNGQIFSSNWTVSLNPIVWIVFAQFFLQCECGANFDLSMQNGKKVLRFKKLTDPVLRSYHWVYEKWSICCGGQRMGQCWLLFLDRWLRLQEMILSQFKSTSKQHLLFRCHSPLFSDLKGAGQKQGRQYPLLEHVFHPSIHQVAFS